MIVIFDFDSIQFSFSLHWSFLHFNFFDWCCWCWFTHFFFSFFLILFDSCWILIIWMIWCDDDVKWFWFLSSEDLFDFSQRVECRTKRRTCGTIVGTVDRFLSFQKKTDHSNSSDPFDILQIWTKSTNIQINTKSSKRSFSMFCKTQKLPTSIFFFHFFLFFGQNVTHKKIIEEWKLNLFLLRNWR